MNGRVQVFERGGERPRLVVGSRGLFVGQLVRPKGVATDSAGNIYVVESYYDHLLVFDREGRFLLPIGGHKGYGLALVVDLFAGLLSGAAYLTHVKSWSENPELAQDLGHFFFVIDAGRLGPPQWLAARMQDFISILHSTPPADPGSPVLVPGEIEMRKLELHRREGIAIDAALRDKLEAYASRWAR